MGVLSGRVAVITGGTRGLGLAIAEAYVREGAAVVVGSRSAAAVEEAIARLRQAGGQVEGIPCDVGQIRDVQALAEHALSRRGRLDIWVNNAGLSAPYGPSIHIPPEYFARVLQTNIYGTYYGSWVAMQHFLGQGKGKLINLLGRGDRQRVPRQNAYASSKAWIRAFTLTLAKEYQGSGVGVYAFNPGLVLTDLLSQVDAIAGYEERLKPLETVTRLWANPPQVPARKAVWLASAATDGRTGLEVRVLTVPRLVAGLLAEAWRIARRRPAPEFPLSVRSVPPQIGR